MKKIFYSLILFISLFIFSDRVLADEPYACYYKSSTVDFLVYDESPALNAHKIRATALSSFKVNNENQDVGATWREKSLQVYGENRKLEITDGCYKYMYYDQVDDWIFGGSNKIYFSNDLVEIKGVDLVLKVAEYVESSENAILEELYCSYGANSEDLLHNGLGDLNTITFKITGNESSGNYEIFRNFQSFYHGTYTKNGKSNNYGYSINGVQYSVYDKFHIRIFLEDATTTWSCPKTIFVGLTHKQGLFTESKERHLAYSNSQVSEFYNNNKWNEYKRNVVNYYLNYDASYVEYEQSSSAQGKMCEFSLENSNNFEIALQEYSYSDGDKFYRAYKKSDSMDNVTINVPSGIIFDDCSGLSEIYTDCLQKEKCTISTTYFDKSTKLVSNAKLNSEDSGTAEEGTKLIDGEEYKQLLCNLSGKVNKLNDKSIINSLPTLKVSNNSGKETKEYKINALDCNTWKYSSTYNCPNGNCDDIAYTISNQVTAIRDYCNGTYDRYLNNMSDAALIARKEECKSFNTFYDSLVKQGIITDLSAGCDFISNDLAEKLIWVLDLLKIAGPILALGLGTLDFIKVIASGDSDKEMKNAFKRFSTRILSAILLFIIPVILAFLMDAFIGNQEGYNIDNPFCIDVYGGK